MKYSILFSKSFDKQFSKLDKPIQQRIITWIEKTLLPHPDPKLLGKSLDDNLNGLYRFRIGTYRIIGDIDDNQLIILALNVGHRKAIYK